MLHNTKQYVQGCLRTESYNVPEIRKRLFDEPNTIRLLHAAMGLCTEASEFLDVLKKHIFYGKPIDKVNLVEEIGDTYWYSAIACDALDITMIETMNINLKKLKKRFPEKFDEQLAIERDIDAERALLDENSFMCDSDSWNK